MSKFLQAAKILNDYSETELLMLSYDYFSDVYNGLHSCITKEELVLSILGDCAVSQNWETLLNLQDSRSYELESSLKTRAHKEAKVKDTMIKPFNVVFRECLMEFFEDEDDLRQFCQIHFKRMFLQLKATDRFNSIIGRLIGYCETRDEMDTLWELIKERNPKIYSKYKVYREY